MYIYKNRYTIYSYIDSSKPVSALVNLIELQYLFICFGFWICECECKEIERAEQSMQTHTHIYMYI